MAIFLPFPATAIALTAYVVQGTSDYGLKTIFPLSSSASMVAIIGTFISLFTIAYSHMLNVFWEKKSTSLSLTFQDQPLGSIYIA